MEKYCDPIISYSKQIQFVTGQCRLIGLDWVVNDTMDPENMLRIRDNKLIYIFLTINNILWNGFFSLYLWPSRNSVLSL
jgi:hypothetical protein